MPGIVKDYTVRDFLLVDANGVEVGLGTLKDGAPCYLVEPRQHRVFMGHYRVVLQCEWQPPIKGENILNLFVSSHAYPSFEPTREPLAWAASRTIISLSNASYGPGLSYFAKQERASVDGSCEVKVPDDAQTKTLLTKIYQQLEEQEFEYLSQRMLALASTSEHGITRMKVFDAFYQGYIQHRRPEDRAALVHLVGLFRREDLGAFDSYLSTLAKPNSVWSLATATAGKVTSTVSGLYRWFRPEQKPAAYTLERGGPPRK